MTTINDISDFARIIREQPEWADTIRSLLLSKELLELPVRFAEFVELTNQNFQLVYERLERLETDMAEVKADVGEVKTRVSNLEASVSRLEASVSRLGANVSRLEANGDSLRTDMNFVMGRLDNAVGFNYEAKVAKSIGGVVGSSFRRVRVQKGATAVPNPDFLDLLDDAEEEGIISTEQHLQVHQLDLILTGRRKSDGAEVYIAAEISITIGDSDITRAAERAAILGTTLSQPVVPVVIGANVDDARTALATANNVALFLSPDD